MATSSFVISWYAEQLGTKAALWLTIVQVGIVGDRTSAADYDDDMKRAKALGIDAFALNIGVDSYTHTQLGYAYESAANNDMAVFISFDFNWYNTGQASDVGQMIAEYGIKDAQLTVDGGKVFASSFAGDGLDVSTLRSTVSSAASGMEVYFAPNFHPGQGDFSQLDGALNWLGWPNNGNNKAPNGSGNVTVQDGDSAYKQALGDKGYIAPVSPWFSTHFGPEVSYSKNWVFPSDTLWFDRWNEIVALKSRFLEIITWNDYGESHYIGPLASKHYDDGNSKWTNDMPHGGWLDMSKPFIGAYKAGDSDVTSYIDNEEVIYWYRQNKRDLNCDATDTTMVDASNSSGNYFKGKPNGWETMKDLVYVVTLLKDAATLEVHSGDQSQTFQAEAGAHVFSVPMGIGKQTFAVTRNGVAVDGLSGDSLKDITNTCSCGLYNFNAYVGTLPAQASDPLGADGLASLTAGLHVSTCENKPSLGSSATQAKATGAATKPRVVEAMVTPA